MAKNYEVPGFSEIILDTVVEGAGFTGEAQSTDVIVEPNTDFMQRYGICTASSILDISNHRGGKVRVMNPSGNKVRIRKESAIGHIQPLGTEYCYFSYAEDPQEMDNMASIRRIKLISENTSPRGVLDDHL